MTRGERKTESRPFRIRESPRRVIFKGTDANYRSLSEIASWRFTMIYDDCREKLLNLSRESATMPPIMARAQFTGDARNQTIDSPGSVLEQLMWGIFVFVRA